MKKFANIAGALLSLAVIAGSVYGVLHARDIMDWFALRNYTPSAQLVQLADQTTMTPQTRKVFYVNHPEILDKQEFRVSCTQQEQTIVLGCYVNTEGIYLLKVGDPRLEGVLQVTAAHEVLHAMYGRLSRSERDRVDLMTLDYFNKSADERIKKTIENYRNKDVNIVANELHSILASEVRDLPPELDAYYARYFTDRKAIVAFSEKYEQTFVDLENQVENYDKELAQLKQTIDTNQTKLQESEARIDSEKQRLDSLLASGNTEEYNSRVAGFNALVNQHNSIIRETQGAVERYNQLVEDRNSLATTEAELVDAIDANSIPKQQ